MKEQIDPLVAILQKFRLSGEPELNKAYHVITHDGHIFYDLYYRGDHWFCLNGNGEYPPDIMYGYKLSDHPINDPA